MGKLENRWWCIYTKEHCCSGLIIGASVIFNHANENWWWQMPNEQENVFADFNV